MTVPAPAHLTYQHLAAALVTERRTSAPTARVLDAGCGEGGLLGFLHRTLPALAPDGGWELHGFDVVDSTSTRSNRPDFPARTLDHLRQVDPGTPWTERIAVASLGEPWPYPDGSFPFVVTNQVLEHVTDAAGFLREVARVLAPGGVCINVFPLRDALLEGHLLVPFAAQVQGHEQRVAWLRAAYRAGLGKPAHRADPGSPERDAAYLRHATVYRSWRQFVALAERAGLTISYRYTGELYRQRLRRATGRALVDRYRRDRTASLDWAAFVTLRHLASVTLVFERPGPGSPYLRGHGASAGR